jgi:hypothetical protein
MPNDWQDKTFKIYESTQSCIVRNPQLITRPLFPTHHSGELSERDQLLGTDDENRVTDLTVYYHQTAACSMKLYILEILNVLSCQSFGILAQTLRTVLVTLLITLKTTLRRIFINVTLIRFA